MLLKNYLFLCLFVYSGLFAAAGSDKRLAKTRQSIKTILLAKDYTSQKDLDQLTDIFVSTTSRNQEVYKKVINTLLDKVKNALAQGNITDDIRQQIFLEIEKEKRNITSRKTKQRNIEAKRKIKDPDAIKQLLNANLSDI